MSPVATKRCNAWGEVKAFVPGANAAAIHKGIVEKPATVNVDEASPDKQAVDTLAMLEDLLVEAETEALVARAAAGLGGGFGLLGLRERAEQLGGDFAAGPREGGGFVLELALPLIQRLSTPTA